MTLEQWLDSGNNPYGLAVYWRVYPGYGGKVHHVDLNGFVYLINQPGMKYWPHELIVENEQSEF